MHILPRVLIPLAALIGLALPGSAAAATLPVKVTVSGKQQSNFNQPKAYGYKDCFNHYWGEHHAHRSFEFSASARGHLHTAPGGLVFFVWRGDYRGGAVFPARNATFSNGYDGLKGADPGDCGGGRPTEVIRGTGCGTESSPHDMDLAVERDRMRIQAVPTKGLERDCGYAWATCLKGGDPWGTLSEKFSLTRLRGRKPRTLELSARDSCGISHNVGGVAWTVGGNQSWKVRIEPEGRWKRF